MPSIPADEKPVVSGPGRTPAEPSRLALIKPCEKTLLQLFLDIFYELFGSLRERWGVKKTRHLRGNRRSTETTKKPTENKVKLREAGGATPERNHKLGAGCLPSDAARQRAGRDVRGPQRQQDPQWSEGRRVHRALIISGGVGRDSMLISGRASHGASQCNTNRLRRHAGSFASFFSTNEGWVASRRAATTLWARYYSRKQPGVPFTDRRDGGHITAAFTHIRSHFSGFPEESNNFTLIDFNWQQQLQLEKLNNITDKMLRRSYLLLLCVFYRCAMSFWSDSWTTSNRLAVNNSSNGQLLSSANKQLEWLFERQKRSWIPVS